MKNVVEKRKREHLDVIARYPETDRSRHYFDALRLRHRALPELDWRAIDPTTVFMDKRLAFPLLISSMTGGGDADIRTINMNLAQAAEQTGIAMAVGSQRVMFSHPPARSSFALRGVAPRALLLANLGAADIDHGLTIEHCREAVDCLGADGLYLHLNPLQEAVQPEGNADFSGVAAAIGRVVEGVDCPVLVKEVGCGISRTDAEILTAKGVRYLDVAGAGGTSWSRIEYHRHSGPDDCPLGLLFEDWGIPTPAALHALGPLRDRLTLIASGGIRSGIDMAKAVILGASLCGIARPFLAPARESVAAVVRLIEALKRQYITALYLLGMPSTAALFGNLDLIAEWETRS